MKNLLITLILLVTTLSTEAQDTTKKSRSESKAEKTALRMEEVKKLLADKNFIFEARQANPSTGQSIQMTSLYDVKISGDTVFSNLPFYGVAYNVEYGSITSPYQFVCKMKEYSIIETEKEYTIEFEIKRKNDVIGFHYSISKNGFATLNVTSINRRPITFYGIILNRTNDKTILAL